jgi:hypothetical protein
MVHHPKLCKSFLKFKENGEMTKELEFQESICSYVPKPRGALSKEISCSFFNHFE